MGIEIDVIKQLKLRILNTSLISKNKRFYIIEFSTLFNKT